VTDGFLHSFLCNIWIKYCIDNRYDTIYLTEIGLSPGGSITVHMYTQTVHRTTQKNIT